MCQQLFVCNYDLPLRLKRCEIKSYLLNGGQQSALSADIVADDDGVKSSQQQGTDRVLERAAGVALGRNIPNLKGTLQVVVNIQFNLLDGVAVRDLFVGQFLGLFAKSTLAI